MHTSKYIANTYTPLTTLTTAWSGSAGKKKKWGVTEFDVVNRALPYFIRYPPPSK